jgi:hypothetical protein
MPRRLMNPQPRVIDMIRRQLIALWVCALMSVSAHAQVQRQFPQSALRGELSFGQPPEVTLNGEAWRLSPGARIRGQNNMLVLSLVGSRWTVHYTTEAPGLVKDIWILRPEELAVEPWPRTAKEASIWVFDGIAQKWSRP